MADALATLLVATGLRTPGHRPEHRLTRSCVSDQKPSCCPLSSGLGGSGVVRGGRLLVGGSRRQLDESPETRESGGGGCGGLQQLVPHPEATCAMWRQLRRLLSTTLPPSHRQLIGLE